MFPALLSKMFISEPEPKPSILTLLMPWEELQQGVLGHCELKTIINLQKSCHHYRDFINSTDFDSNFEDITINYTENSINLDIYGRIMRNHIRLEYQKDPRGCLILKEEDRLKEGSADEVERTTTTKIMENETNFDCFFRDFEIIMDFQSYDMDRLSLCLRVPDQDGFMERIHEYFLHRQNLLRTRKVSLDTTNQAEALLVLPFMDSYVLEDIVISYSNREVLSEEITDLRQWKCAKRLTFDGFTIENMDRMVFRSKEAEAWTSEVIGYEELMELKEKFTHSRTLTSLNLWLHNEIDPTVFEDLGPIFLQKETHDFGSTKQWIILLPNYEKVLCLEANETLIRFYYINLVDFPVGEIRQKFQKTSFMDMTDVTMGKLLAKLNLKTILKLRKLCYGLRNFIDDNIVDTNLSELFVYTYQQQLTFRLREKQGYGFLVIDQRNSHSVLNDFLSILTIQNTTLPFFTIDAAQDPDLMTQLLNGIEKTLRSRPRPLQVIKLNLQVKNAQEILQVLPYLDPKTLDQIDIRPSNQAEAELEMSEIMELEQFKNVHGLGINHFTVKKSVKDFLHLSRLSMKFDGIPVEDIVVLKETFTNSTHMTIFSMDGHQLTEERLEEVFGRPSFNTVRNHKMWYFKMKNSPEYALTIEIVQDLLVFSRVKTARISENVVIRD